MHSGENRQDAKNAKRNKQKDRMKTVEGRMISVVLGVLGVLAVHLSGCRSGGETTTLTHDDLNEVVARMASSLAGSEFLAGRAPDSPPIVVTINKVENLTSDIIPPAEQWMQVARLQGSLPIRRLADEKNIRFQLPPERLQLLADSDYTPTIEERHEYVATHLMKAVYQSATRVGRDEKGGQVESRQEYYTMRYQITEIESRRVVWEDSFEFKREARGVAID